LHGRIAIFQGFSQRGYCACVWFDAKEFEAVPKLRPARETPMAPKAKRAAALFEVQQMQRKQEFEELGEMDTGAPAEAWQWIPGIFGLPVEYESPGLGTLPWLTWSIAALTVVLFIATVGYLEEVIENWGFIPAELGRHGGLTILASFFLHAGVFHVISNMYFFLVFGDNVEDDLGRLSFVMLLVAAHLTGCILHGVFDPRPDIPLVGASAGISGIIAYYAVMFPRASTGTGRRWRALEPRWCPSSSPPGSSPRKHYGITAPVSSKQQKLMPEAICRRRLNRPESKFLFPLPAKNLSKPG